MTLPDAATINAMAVADGLMREALLDRLTELYPLPEKEPARARFDTLTTKDLRHKVMAFEEEQVQKTLRAQFLPDVQAAQRQPMNDGVLPTWPLVNAMAAVARAAGPGLMRYFNTKAFYHSHQYKLDGSPASNADRDAEDLIRSGLRAIAPFTPFVGEETVHMLPEHQDIGPKGQFWLVDALDSTRSFIEGHPEFTVNIALIRNGRAAAGVVYAPAQDRMYKGLGHQRIATVATAHRERLLQVRTRPPEQRRAVIPYKAVDEAALAAFRQEQGIRRTFRESSSLRLCRVAEGRADLYPQFGAYAEWDVAAAVPVVEGAGGVVLSWPEAQPLRFGNRKAGFKMPNMVVGSTRDILKIG